MSTTSGLIEADGLMTPQGSAEPPDLLDPAHALTACGLPQAWRGREQWRILSTDFGVGEDFFQTLNAWRADPERPARLHFCALLPRHWPGAWPGTSLHSLTELWPAALPDRLRDAVSSGLPGVHRLEFDDGRVTLTLCVAGRGDTLRDQLQELDFHADTVWTDSHIHGHLKTLARCCARGSSLLLWLNINRYGAPSPAELQGLRNAIRQCGWVEGVADTASTASALPPTVLVARYDPAWVPRRAVKSRGPVTLIPVALLPAGAAASTAHGLPSDRAKRPGHAIVVGAGLAGAAMAHSLARRGWEVTVLDAAKAPAQGTSALPAGLAVPQVSPDDNILSRLSRNGLALLTQFAREHLRVGIDWSPSGVMEHVDVSAPRDGTMARPTQERPSPTTRFHPSAAWFKPAALVSAWLDHPRICWKGEQSVQGVQSASYGARLPPNWQVLGANDAALAQGDLVVLCAAFTCKDLLPHLPQLPLQAVRGVATWAHHGHFPLCAAPAYPVNGQGSFISHVPLDDGSGGDFWIAGAGYERDQTQLRLSHASTAQHHLSNLVRLCRLIPEAASIPSGDPGLRAFVGIRCATPDRLPIAGPIANQPGLWVSTGMGSRGLSFALLCAELIAAQLHGEPLPLEARLARALSAQRFG